MNRNLQSEIVSAEDVERCKQKFILHTEQEYGVDCVISVDVIFSISSTFQDEDCKVAFQNSPKRITLRQSNSTQMKQRMLLDSFTSNQLVPLLMVDVTLLVTLLLPVCKILSSQSLEKTSALVMVVLMSRSQC